MLVGLTNMPTSKAREALRTGDYNYAKCVALVEIAESLVRIATALELPEDEAAE